MLSRQFGTVLSSRLGNAVFSATRPSHFVSYSATDQSTVRSLRDVIDGILVPGTVASFQRDGTAGFVLSLSATEESPPYVIDPRFPLFQQQLVTPKKSHWELANVFGDPSLVQVNRKPEPADFDSRRLGRIAESWVDFNLSYRSRNNSKFDKYAKRLGLLLAQDSALGPQRILAPYFCVSGIRDAWWQLSEELYETVRNVADNRIVVTRVLAVDSARTLRELVDEVTDHEVCIWVSGLDELRSDPSELTQYGEAIARLESGGRQTFALYGGFFAVLLSAIGLGGFSHGIGYGERREWRELPTSGPPPSRYYLPTAHRYILQADAQRLWLHDRALVGFDDDGEPRRLSYHGLMRRSVIARSREIEAFRGLGLRAVVEKLEEDLEDFHWRLYSDSPGEIVVRVGLNAVQHLQYWIDVLKDLGDLW